MASDKLIIFLLPPEKIVSGGILSIFSLCEETRRLKDIHKCNVALAIIPGFPTYRQHDLFDNNETVYEFEELIKLHPSPQKLLIHIPEYLVDHVSHSFEQHATYFSSVPDLAINVLNQNILLMPGETTVSTLFRLSKTVTQTTAHLRYATQEQANKYCTPVHHMSVYLDSSQYVAMPFEKKDKIIVVSPDEHPKRDEILQRIETELPDYTLTVVQNMSYEKYKEVVSKARFILSFGEGLDGYLIEATFTRGVAFAVYNDDFFDDSSFRNAPTLYDSYEALAQNIVKDIRHFEKKSEYTSANEALFSKLASIYNTERYRKKVKNYYMKNYDYTVEPACYATLLCKVETKRATQKKALREEASSVMHKLTNEVAKSDSLERSVAELNSEVSHLSTALEHMRTSLSWKITYPLRQINRLRK